MNKCVKCGEWTSARIITYESTLKEFTHGEANTRADGTDKGKGTIYGPNYRPCLQPEVLMIKNNIFT
jgi:hypothetical protein